MSQIHTEACAWVPDVWPAPLPNTPDEQKTKSGVRSDGRAAPGDSPARGELAPQHPRRTASVQPAPLGTGWQALMRATLLPFTEAGGLHSLTDCLWGSEPGVRSPLGCGHPRSEASGSVGVGHSDGAFGDQVPAEGPRHHTAHLALTDNASGEQPCGPAASRGRQL